MAYSRAKADELKWAPRVVVEMKDGHVGIMTNPLTFDDEITCTRFLVASADRIHAFLEENYGMDNVVKITPKCVLQVPEEKA